MTPPDDPFENTTPRNTDKEVSGLPQDKLPFAPEAEQRILGSILFDPNNFGAVHELLKPDDFYREAHRTIFKAMMDAASDNRAVDYTSIMESLRARQVLDEIGGETFLLGLLDSNSPTTLVVEYARIVQDRAQSRRLIQTAQEVVQSGLSGEYDNAGDYAQFAESKLLDTLRNNTRGNVLEMREILTQTLNKIEALCETDSELTGISTGFQALDNQTLGLHGGELLIVAARPGMGKSAFALNIAANAAIQGEKAVLLFSLEMSAEQLGMRLLAQEGRVPLQSVRSGTLDGKDFDKLHKAMSLLMPTKISLDATPSLSVLDICARARRLNMENKCDLVLIDYLQLVNGRPGIDSRQEVVADVSRSLKQLSIELDIPVIALSQLNRSVESRKPPKPLLSDLRESGAIEQDADVIMFIYRDEYYNPDSTEKPGIAEIDVAKQRSGPTGSFEVKFTGKYTRFDNLDPGYMGADLNVQIGGIPGGGPGLPPAPEAESGPFPDDLSDIV